jgi:aryl-alcohol dehydrogenase-like predicted oxidoreductase
MHPKGNTEGVNLVDTSDNYHNEEFVGAGLAQVDLSKVTVISKFSQPFRTNELERTSHQGEFQHL